MKNSIVVRIFIVVIMLSLGLALRAEPLAKVYFREGSLLCYNDYSTWLYENGKIHSSPFPPETILASTSATGILDCKTTMPMQDCELSSLFKLANKALGGKPKINIFAFHAGAGYGIRYKVLPSLRSKNSSTRLSTVSELAALGYLWMQSKKTSESDELYMVIISTAGNALSATWAIGGMHISPLHSNPETYDTPTANHLPPPANTRHLQPFRSHRKTSFPHKTPI